ncbi:FeoA family protein [Clostridium tepidum]|jgi:ferrous iron transport protein A|uniref:Ferrous iron transport protein A n=1 Tax=Clostridium tepidum TaxID=1962263 RepID=A0A1S9I1I8_9CLOT|nr:FeoA family protein [Clostridium tepidum]MCR1934725.1 ferrous iron transport protein A [Clostridium tepidum]MDU6878269.1 FeoA family protein [Clostridium botulinum]OOO62212.1 ferrous iron transport protein A [Clostridium tepidum]OOO64177.1 ferrous iron transport protein A [Clostridium tepidum]
MTLAMAREGEVNKIKKITGRDNVRQFLAKLGFVEGESVTVISEISGNMIINVKDSRIAIGKSMANRIIV